MVYRAMKKILLALVAFFSISPALAQWQVPQFNVPIGRGSGTGFSFAAPGVAGQLLTSTGTASNPAFSGTLNLPTKGQTIGAQSTPLMPAAPAVTDASIILYNISGTNWAGMGTDTTGDIWFKTGISGSPIPTLILNGDQTIGGSGVATVAQYFAGTANKIPQTGAIYTAEVVIPNTTGTFNIDFSTFINGRVDFTQATLTMTGINVIAGKAGVIRFNQTAGGVVTVVWPTQFRWPGGVPGTLTGINNTIDILGYNCITTTYCAVALIKGFANN
jgi:hypothetical protein